MEFPGGRVPFTSALQFIGGAFDTSRSKIPCYRTLDGTGQHIEDAAVPHELSQEQATQLYTAMAKLQVMDTICYDAQRQVRACVCVLACLVVCVHARCTAQWMLEGLELPPWGCLLHVNTNLLVPRACLPGPTPTHTTCQPASTAHHSPAAHTHPLTEAHAVHSTWLGVWLGFCRGASHST